MKNFLSIAFLLIIFFIPQALFAAEVVFSISPNTVPGDNAVIIDVFLIPEDSESINAIEGRIGILGEGAESVTDVVVELGDSVFSFWPVTPTYDKNEKIIRFTGGGPDSLLEKGKILSLRLFADEEKTITLSWLGGLAYQDDGQGTPVGISSRSITFTPHSGAPNQIRSTSADSKPPTIQTIEIASDEDVFDGKSFLSIYATDDITGVSHYEVVEDGNTTRVENGPYLIQNQAMEKPLHITVYDKAGNGISVKYPEEKIDIFKLWGGLVILLLILIISIRYFIKVRN